MSREEREFKSGFERGSAGSAEKYGLFESDIGDSSAEKAARRRGFEAGQQARGTAKAIAERLRESGRGDRSESTYSSSSSSSSGTDFGIKLVLGGLAYLVVVAGAFVVIQKVATWSFVWWLCVLAIVAGIPLFIGLLHVLFYITIAGLVVSIIVAIIDHFVRNPY